MKLDNGDLLALFKTVVDEQYLNSKMYFDYAKWFLGANTAIFAAVFAGFLKSSVPSHYVVLCIGFLIVIGVSQIAIETTWRFYKRFLEVVSVRAKLEHALGLTDQRNTGEKNESQWWEKEPIVFTNDIREREKYSSSYGWFKGQTDGGVRQHIRLLFRTFQWVSVLLIVALVLYSFYGTA